MANIAEWTRSQYFGFVLALMLTITLLVLKTSMTSNLQIIPATVADNEDVQSYKEPAKYSDVYQQRITRVHEVCFEENIAKSPPTKAMQFSNQYGIAFKRIAKVGTTLGITIFDILNDVKAQYVLTESRNQLHRHATNGETIVKVKTLKNYTILFPTRDPYTRLYSAFIDKLYIFNSMALVHGVVEYAKEKEESIEVQKHNVTFQMFLDYVLDQSLSEHVRGLHYYPIFNRNTWLCLLRDFIVIKQESFSTDMEYALKAVKVEKEKMEVIRNVLYLHRADVSVASIIRTVIGEKLKGIVQIGQFKEGAVFVLIRLWSSFQIQGYIDAKANFPVEKFASSSSVSDVDYVVSIFCEEIKQHPLLRSESKRQRDLAIHQAYASIKADTIKKIQEVYRLDFKAFGYNSSWS